MARSGGKGRRKLDGRCFGAEPVQMADVQQLERAGGREDADCFATQLYVGLCPQS